MPTGVPCVVMPSDSRIDATEPTGTHAPDLPPPPPRSLFARMRTRWRSRGRHTAFKYWILFRGIPFAVFFGALFVLNGFVIGWREAYDVSLSITSPASTSSPLTAWILSVAGWLAAPALAGAVAGHVVTASISGRRKKPVGQLFDGSEDE
ncbi:DUF6313 family protein [Amycolatopsis circi]|uniref:DUF6313 family protein n=1 Tax=Amycolatopsis circi TaxID=871959 RepID=UPI003CC5216F